MQRKKEKVFLYLSALRDFLLIANQSEYHFCKINRKYFQNFCDVVTSYDNIDFNLYYRLVKNEDYAKAVYDELTSALIEYNKSSLLKDDKSKEKAIRRLYPVLAKLNRLTEYIYSLNYIKKGA